MEGSDGEGTRRGIALRGRVIFDCRMQIAYIQNTQAIWWVTEGGWVFDPEKLHRLESSTR